MTDKLPESLKELVAKRIVEELHEGRLNDLLDLLKAALPQASAQPQLSGGGQLGATLAPVETAMSGEVIYPSAEMIGIIDSVSFQLVPDHLRNRSPQDIKLAIEFIAALLNLLAAAIVVYHVVHGEPPSQQRVIQIFNDTTNVINQAR